MSGALSSVPGSAIAITARAFGNALAVSVVPSSGVDIYLGSGGAPEGVLAAAALRCIGGQMQGKLLFRNEDEKKRARNCGITDFSKVYGLMDMARGDVMFAATGVTDGSMLKGVRRADKGVVTNSIVMRSSTGTVRLIEAQHNFERKAVYGHPGR